VILGLSGFEPATLDPDRAEVLEAEVRATGVVTPPGLPPLRFAPETDLDLRLRPAAAGHANGMILRAFDTAGNLYLEETYYSVGGGFVMTERELDREAHGGAEAFHEEKAAAGYPHPFGSAQEMLAMGRATGKIHRRDEMGQRDGGSAGRGQAGIDAVWRRWTIASNAVSDGGRIARRPAGEAPGQGASMSNCWRSGIEPCAAAHRERLAQRLRHGGERGERGGGPCRDLAHQWRGGRGARGPALLPRPLHRRDGGGAARVPADGLGHRRADQAQRVDLGRRGGMPGGGRVGLGHGRGGLCAALGGTNEQIENAAEIALEHHLGMTCDPAGGLVQVPCIERNGLGAIKAVSAASLALRGDGTHFMPLDNCIEAMRQTGLDMSTKYKETSQGGLAVNLPEC
jgi:L-serine dehydratase